MKKNHKKYLLWTIASLIVPGILAGAGLFNNLKSIQDLTTAVYYREGMNMKANSIRVLGSDPAGTGMAAASEGLIWLDGSSSINSQVNFGDSMFTVRKAATVSVSSATAAKYTGIDIPAGSHIRSAAVNAETGITGASSADRFGLGDNLCTDGDKYTETTALTANSKGTSKLATLVSTYDQLHLCAMTDASTEGGTIGGSGESIRVEVIYDYVQPLPDAS